MYSYVARSFLEKLCKVSHSKEKKGEDESGCCTHMSIGLIFRAEWLSPKKARSGFTPKMQPHASGPRSKFRTSTLHMLEEVFTNHESIPPFDLASESFKNLYPDYVDTFVVDYIRDQEYGNLDVNNHVCLDYSGYGLFSYLQQELDLISCSFSLAYQTANLPAQALYGGTDENTAEFDIKKRISKFLKIDDSDYCMVFTANRGSAFKLLAESYPFHINNRLLTVYDYESQGVTWMEEVARKKGATITNAHFRWPTLRLCSSDLKKQIFEKKKKKKQTAKGMFVFPLQSRVSGAKYSYQWMSHAQENGWHVLFDASALGPKAMDAFGMSLFQPDFIISSFYKVYGSDPTGFGCLFIKRSAIHYLHNSSAARGVGMVKIIPLKASLPKMLRTASNSEKQECHEIEEKDEQASRRLAGVEAGHMELVCMPSFSGLLTSHKGIETGTGTGTGTCTGSGANLSSLKKKVDADNEVGTSAQRTVKHAAHCGITVDNKNHNSAVSCHDYSQGSKNVLVFYSSVKNGNPQAGKDVGTRDEMSDCHIATDGKSSTACKIQQSGDLEQDLSEDINLVTQNLEQDIGTKCFKGNDGIIASSSCKDYKVESSLKRGGSKGFDQAYTDSYEPSSRRPSETKYKLDSDVGRCEAFGDIKNQTGDGLSTFEATAEREIAAMAEILEEQHASSVPKYLSKEKDIQTIKTRLTRLHGPKGEIINSDSKGSWEMGEADRIHKEYSSGQVSGDRPVSYETENFSKESINGQSDIAFQQETKRCDVDHKSGIERSVSLGLAHNQVSAVEKLDHSWEGVAHVYDWGGQSGILRSSMYAETSIHGSDESNEIDLVDDLFTGRREPEIICRGLNHADSLSLFKMNNRHRYLVNWFVASMLKLRHPGPENAINLTQIYGPKVKYDRGASVAFNLFDWKGVLLQPVLVQRLADRSNVSLGIGTLHHIQFPEGHTDMHELLENKKGSNHATRTVEETDTARGKSTTIEALTASLGFLTNFKDVYRLWAFTAKFLDADFVAKEVWRYRSLNQETVVVGGI